MTGGGLGGFRFLIKELAPPGIDGLSRDIDFYPGTATVTFDDKPHPFIAVVPAMPGKGLSYRHGQFREGMAPFKLLLKIVIEAHNHPFCRNSP